MMRGVGVWGTVNVHIKKTGKSCCDAVTVGLFELSRDSHSGGNKPWKTRFVFQVLASEVNRQRMEGDHCRKEEPKCGEESGVNPDHHTPKSKLRRSVPVLLLDDKARKLIEICYTFNFDAQHATLRCGGWQRAKCKVQPRMCCSTRP